MMRKRDLVIVSVGESEATIADGDRQFSLPLDLLPTAARAGDAIKMAVALDLEAQPRQDRRQAMRQARLALARQSQERPGAPEG